MAFPVPQYSRSQVNRAGRILVEPLSNLDDAAWAVDVLTNWRSSHGYPINTFQATLRNKLKGIDPPALVAQRLKRTPSIIGKLSRFENMQLSRMQDIGGLRAVVKTMKKLRELEDNYRRSGFRHELVTTRDYIGQPKDSGYRSVHLIYRYKNKLAPEYDGLLVELQFRTRIQHAWATAVETMGTFLNHALKSSEGPEVWLEFFSLAGAGFAHLENCPRVPGYENMSRQEVFRKIDAEAAKLDIRGQLDAFTIALDKIVADEQASSYHLIVLNPVERTVNIRSYARGQIGQASLDYTTEERRITEGESIQVVLVSAGPLDALRHAYPNYFLDTAEFVKQLDRISKAA